MIQLQNVAEKIVSLMWWHIGHVYSINSNESREMSFWSSLPGHTNKNTACNQRLLFICTHKYNFSCCIPTCYNRSKGKRSKFLFVGKRQKKGGGSSHFLVEQTDWEQRYRWGHNVGHKRCLFVIICCCFMFCFFLNNVVSISLPPWDRCRTQSFFCLVLSFVVCFFLVCLLLICSNFGFCFSNKHLRADVERDSEFFFHFFLCLLIIVLVSNSF